MYLKLHFGTGVKVSSPEALAYVKATAIYYDEQYQEIIVRLENSDTDLATPAAASLWEEFTQRLEEALTNHELVDATSLPLFHSVSQEYALLHWRPYDISQTNRAEGV